MMEIKMEKIAILIALFIFTIKPINAQDMMPPPPVVVNVTQNVTVSPNQTMNVSLQVPGGGRIFGALGGLLGLLGKKTDDGFLGRCLGAARKLKFIMPFIIFKLGVIVTTLAFLTLFSLKGLGVLLLLLMLNGAGWISKAALFKSMHGGYGGWKDYSSHAPSPAVHLHVHKAKDDTIPISHSPPSSYQSEYGGPTAWSERISKGLSETKSNAEKYELMKLYKRLGFNVNSALRYANSADQGRAYISSQTFDQNFQPSQSFQPNQRYVAAKKFESPEKPNQVNSVYPIYDTTMVYPKRVQPATKKSN